MGLRQVRASFRSENVAYSVRFAPGENCATLKQVEDYEILHGQRARGSLVWDPRTIAGPSSWRLKIEARFAAAMWVTGANWERLIGPGVGCMAANHTWSSATSQVVLGSAAWCIGLVFGNASFPYGDDIISDGVYCSFIVGWVRALMLVWNSSLDILGSCIGEGLETWGEISNYGRHESYCIS
jgi:hypothetical protein